MERNRIWMFGAVLVVGVALVLGWLLGISPQLEGLQAARTERLAVEAQNVVYELQLDALKNDFEDIDGVQGELAELRTSVPTGAQLPEFVAEVDALAAQSGLSLSGMTVADAEPYEPLATVVPVDAAVADPAATDPAATDAAATDDAAASAPVAPVAPAAPEAVMAVPTVTNELITAANFVTVPVTITLVGGYDQVLDFLDGLRRGERLVSVSAVSTVAVEAGTIDALVTPDASDTPGVTASISALIFVLRDPGAD
jgi:Tfp pilus assembly protein PilO